MPKLVGKDVFRLILAHTLVLSVDVQYTFFDSGGMCVAMVTAYYAKTCGKRCFQINFGTHFGLEV